MWKVLVAAAMLSTTVYAADVDRRLATAATAYVYAADPLKDDGPVAACLAERLEKLTPYKTAGREEAEVLLAVKAHVYGAMGKSMGTLGLVQLEARAQDGTKIWGGVQNVGTRQFGTLAPTQGDVACVLADAIAEELRKAMRKARDQKEK